MSVCDAIGIDLGTSFCRAAVFIDGKVELIRNKKKNQTTPSVVAFRKHDYLIGEDALEGAIVNEKNSRVPRNVVLNVKRLAGRWINDEKVLQDEEYCPFHFTAVGPNFKIKVDFQNRSYYPEEIAGILLSDMKENAEKHLNRPVTKAMITVPASFNNLQRQATVNAGKLAGFEKVQLINKPTAIAMNYYYESRMKGKKVLCVFHLGGGSFDVSIIEVNGSSCFEVKATVGNSHLGGVDFDERLIDCFVDKCVPTTSQNSRNNLRKSLQVRIACHQAKIALSSNQEFATITAEGFTKTVRRVEYEHRCKELCDEMRYHVERLFEKSRIERNEIDDVLIVGGSTQNPRMRLFVKSLFEQKNGHHVFNSLSNSAGKNTRFHCAVNQPAVRGAAIHAATASNRIIVDKVPSIIGSRELLPNQHIDCQKLVLHEGTTNMKKNNRHFTVPHGGFILEICEEEEDWKKNRIPSGHLPETLIERIEIASRPQNTPELDIDVEFVYDESCTLTIKSSAYNPSTYEDANSILLRRHLTEEKDVQLRNLTIQRKLERDRTKKQIILTKSDIHSFIEQKPDIGKEKERCSTKESYYDTKSPTIGNKRKHAESGTSSSTTKVKIPKLTLSNSEKPSKIAIGIDIGTTSSHAAVFYKGKINVLDNEHGKKTTPSTVKFTEQETLVGEKGGLNVTNSILNVKRLLGNKFSDNVVQSDIQSCSYNVLEENLQPIIKVETRNHSITPEEVTSFIIRKMKMIAANFVGNEVKEAVITVPAFFDDRQRQATIDAATIAGLDTVQLINSSTAAAVAYYTENPTIGKRNMFVLSFGGGSIEASVLIVDGFDIKVKRTVGNNHYGGADFDNRLIRYFIHNFENHHSSKNVSKNKRALFKLREATVEAKRKLSSLEEAEIEITSLFDDEDFKMIITRNEFEEICDDIFNIVIRVVKRTFYKMEIAKSQIDDILLIGGSTRIPMIRTIIRNFFGGEEKIRHSVNFDEACVYGAAVVAAKISGVNDEKIMSLDVHEIPASIRSEVSNGRLTKEEIGKIMARIEQMDRKTEEYKKLSEAKNKLEEYTLSVMRKLKPLESRYDLEDSFNACEQTLEWINSDEKHEIGDVVQLLIELKQICEPIIIELNL